MRRKTRPRVVWLPNTNANSLGAVNRSTTQTFILDLNTSTIGDVVVGEIPIVIDSQDDVNEPLNTLSDIENSGYRLRRIVGKIFVGVREDPADGHDLVICTAGLIIRRSDPVSGNSLAATTGNPTLIDPQDIVNIGDPWIWRRSWVFGSNVDQFLGGVNPWPTANTQNGSVADGPHVDAKTARIVSSEERLFLDVSMTLVTGAGNLTSALVVADLRALGSMRLSSGNRGNASR